mgnify:CR=1 FL=1
MIKTGTLGNRAEKLAADYLSKRTLTLIKKNHHCRVGEIDLIMRDRDYLVFVEVRYRRSDTFGGALESVDYRKQNKLRKAAEHYLIQTKQQDSPARFDVLCVNGSLNKPHFHWIKNAF